MNKLLENQMLEKIKHEIMPDVIMEDGCPAADITFHLTIALQTPEGIGFLQWFPDEGVWAPVEFDLG